MSYEAPPACDYLMFTAVSSEKKAVHTVATELQLQVKKGKSVVGDYIDLGRIGLSRVLAVETQMGPFASTGSAAKALRWLGATQAKAIIGVGMAFGTLPSKQRLGDVMVATALLPYDYKIVRCGSDEVPAADYSEVPTYPAQPQLIALFERAARLPQWQGRVHPGLFLSGAARIFCSTYRDELVRAFLDRGIAIGGDMEGIGLLASSDETESRWVIVKGISDFADEKRNDVVATNRPTACYNAARFVLSALKEEETLRAQP